MVLSPAPWVEELMQLSPMALDYKTFLVGLGAAYLVAAWLFEKHLSARLVRLLGRLVTGLTGHEKRRKGYKTVREGMFD